MPNQERDTTPGLVETVPPRARDDEERSQADVTPDPAPPLDDTDVRPLTDPDETMGG
jgi:hypothetical protein